MAWYSSFIHNDKVILGGVGLSAVTLILSMRFILDRWRDETEIKPVQPKTQYITQDTEDSLKTSTLSTLISHYNYTIRETAAKIISERAVNDSSTLDYLLWGITRPDYDERMKNLRALAIITDPHSLILLHQWKAYTALVRSLELCVDPEQETLDDDDWDEYPLRDMTEKLCLMFLCQLVGHFDSEQLIKAGFVEKWLARQNWGDSDEARMDNFAHYMIHRNNRITDIVSSIQRSTVGKEALEKAGLIRRESPLDSLDEDSSLLGRQSDRYNLLVSIRMRARSLEQSAEEQRMRHRNREAMVLNDGTHPVHSDDIIHRSAD
ncbi:hypothetical protein B0T22DRAFT_104060 [Podospora appendiculata]|uniref:Cytoskeleton-associated protein n=1 Tax=Podospora appendiculata TaxID=314037 RepID=A0AAE1CIA9_9PEZI|nr:hypothetical protein B0T22DRAFT_104060 [Podospora appendiculata]